MGVDHKSIRNGFPFIKSKGPVGLLNQPKNNHYSKELKISAINDYLNGKGSLQDIYKIWNSFRKDSFRIGLRCIILVEHLKHPLEVLT